MVLLAIAGLLGVDLKEDEKVYGTVVPFVEIQPIVGKNVVVEHVLWTVTVMTGTSEP